MPSARLGTAGSGLSMPSRCATSTTLRGPTASASRTVATLSERSIASRTPTRSWNWLSKFFGRHGPEGVLISSGESSSVLASVITGSASRGSSPAM